jgi:Fuseless
MVSLLPLLYLAGIVAVVMMWRGIWGLGDLYLWPKNPKLSYWVSFVAGLVVIVIIVLLLDVRV